uniref:Uncharacterized protein n=1 Tax=viral metagenome TaxID=1070528 RepID=A0A6C0CMP6_9ZZZZ
MIDKLYSLHRIFTMKFLFLFLAFLSFGAALYFFFYSKMIKSTDKVQFLIDSQTQEILNNDTDHYYQTFHKTDFKVRKSKNLKDYLAKISKSGCDGTEENKEKILACIKKIETKLQNSRNDVAEGVHIGKMLDLKWIIGFTCDKYYENGLPHTRGDVILLNNKDLQRRNIDETCKLLIHEKVHVYQKTYSEDFSQSIQESFERVDSSKVSKSIPANPDTDNYIYKRKDDGKWLKSKYNKNPKHFRDIQFPDGDHTLEHPYESVAYSLENLY